VKTLATFLLWLAVAIAQPDRFALPRCPAHTLDHSLFQLCYDSTLKTPLWAGYELKASQPAPARTRPVFRRDPLHPSSASNLDYRRSGFSRGHLVPAADSAYSEEAHRGTFLLTNVVPQLQSVNAGHWRELENAVRRLAEYSDALYIFTGPLLDSAPMTIGPSRIPVPSQL